MDSLVQRIKGFDAYPKTLEDFHVRTFSGATISIVATVFILFLFFSELAYYMSTEVVPELFVDTTRGEKLQINIDIVFPHLACAVVGLDAMDVSGESQLGIEHNISKRRLDARGDPIAAAIEKEQHLGKPLPTTTETPSDDPSQTTAPPPKCGDCYGAQSHEGQCCNTCEQVREAYRLKGWAFTNPEGIAQCVREGFTQKLVEQEGEGCHIYGYLLVNKVAGNFHFAPGRSFQNMGMHVHDLHSFTDGRFNISHHINTLSFGKPFPGNTNPLDDVDKAAPGVGTATFQYYIKIVPTIYENLHGKVLNTNQFSVTEHMRELDMGPHVPGAQKKPGQPHNHGLPGVFFMYDLSPIMVKFTERSKAFSHFLSGLCAIIGGIFTVAGTIHCYYYTVLFARRRRSASP